MGLLNTSAEVFDVPNWMLAHPELEVQLDGVNTPVFTIWFVVTTKDKQAFVYNRNFSIAEITDIRFIKPGELRGIIQKNIATIGDHIVKAIRDDYSKNVKIKFISHVHIGG